jgi:hypothetical protein
MGGGGSGPDTSTTTTGMTLPPELQPLFRDLAWSISHQLPAASTVIGEAMQAQPQEVAGMTPEEEQWRASAMGMIGGSGLTQAQREARRGLRQFTAGDIGSSPATLAAMQAFRQQQLPSILQGSAVSGLGQGAIAEAAANASQQAYVPLVQQEMQNRLSAEGQLANLGAQGYAQQVGLQGIAGMPREIMDRRGQAVYQDLLRRQGLASNLMLDPFGRLSQPGQTSKVVNTGGGK